MIRIAALMAVLATPVAADMRVTQAECTGSWIRALTLVFGAIPDALAQENVALQEEAFAAIKVSRTNDGWCQVDPGPFGALLATDLEDVRWRADDLGAFVNDTGLPRRFQLRLTGGASGPSDLISYISLTLQHLPDEGLLLIEDLDLGHPNDTPIAVSAVFGGAYFDDIGSALLSIGGLNLQQLEATVAVTPELIAELAPDLTAGWLESSVAAMSFEQLDRQDRRAVLDFANALPDATGDLAMEFVSERGLGLIQVGMAQSREDAEIVSFLLSGATVGVDWQPE